jgi:mannosyltransferase OCH1-like enzyme
MIPKIIHQMWIGPYAKPDKLMDTWKNLNPDWEYMEWNNDTIKNESFVNHELINNTPQYSGKKDIMSYEILKKYGGFFADADSDCIKSLDDFLLNNESFGCWESEEAKPGLIANGYLGCEKNSPLMDLLINDLKKLTSVQEAWMQTGPLLLTKMVNTYNYTRLKIYPSGYFIPVHHTGLRQEGNGPTYCNQYWGTSKKLYLSGNFGVNKVKEKY